MRRHRVTRPTTAHLVLALQEDAVLPWLFEQDPEPGPRSRHPLPLLIARSPAAASFKLCFQRSYVFQPGFSCLLQIVAGWIVFHSVSLSTRHLFNDRTREAVHIVPLFQSMLQPFGVPISFYITIRVSEVGFKRTSFGDSQNQRRSSLLHVLCQDRHARI